MPPPQARRSSWRSLTVLCVLAMALGFAAGLGAERVPAAARDGLAALARAWTNALRLLVVPLIVARLFLTIAEGRTSKREARRFGVCTPLVLAGLWCVVAALTLAVAMPLLELAPLRALSLSAPAAPPPPSAGPATAADPAAWVDAFVPPNLFAAMTTANILPLMLFALAFALAARRLPDELRRPLETACRAVAEATFVLVRWVMVAAPLVVFAVTFGAVARGGTRVGDVLLAYVALASSLSVLATLALYLLAVLLGRVPPGRFARALLPAQIAAANTRSSLATVPVLLQSADEVLGIPRSHSTYVLPLAGATLKVSRAVNNPLTLVFLLHVLGLTLTPVQLLVFLATVLLLSPTTAGLPSVRSENRSLPAFVAAGVPPEYVIWLGATTVFTDVLQTVANTTSYMTANVLVHRFVGGGSPRLRPGELAEREPELAARLEAQLVD